MYLNIKREGRANDQMRKITLEPNFLPHAEGSCLVKFGNTHVVCTASVDSFLPPFIRNTGQGWVTAEYGMLPRSTSTRMQRESAKGKQDGRTQEIQRLIGRSLRSVVDLKALGERQITIDCDVIRADGGTRTASITGAYVALCMACKWLLERKIIKVNPIRSIVAAISCGLVNGISMLDLEYIEDSHASVDANFIISDSNKFIEIQMTAEKEPFTNEELESLKNLALSGCKELFKLQKNAIAEASSYR